MTGFEKVSVEEMKATANLVVDMDGILDRLEDLQGVVPV